jgi:hypothetical protein
MVPARPFFKGSDGCVRISLDLALLVHAQHHRLVGRVQIDADHIDQLLIETAVIGELEGAPA